MHMYRIAKVEMPEYFRAELSQFMSKTEEDHSIINPEQWWSI